MPRKKLSEPIVLNPPPQPLPKFEVEAKSYVEVRYPHIASSAYGGPRYKTAHILHLTKEEALGFSSVIAEAAAEL